MGKFEIIKGRDSNYRFNLIAGNGEIIATSESYSSLDGCKGGVESVRKNCLSHIEDQTAGEEKKHPKFELYLDKGDEFRFRLKASNGETICHSEGYKSKASAKNGIASVGKNAPDAPVIVID